MRKFGNSEKVKVGIDPWVSSGRLYKPLDNLIATPKGIPNLAQETL